MSRCELTELPVESCACRHHRGGKTPLEQQDAAREVWAGRVFLARFPGHCAVCEEPVAPGEQIVSAGGRGTARYRHAGCEED